MMIIGITGSFGSGKTTVANMFAGLGAFVIDADELYHSLIKPGKICHRKIIQNFGTAVLKKDGCIDRKILGRIVFKNKSKLRLLNSLVHPEVIKEAGRIIGSRKEKVIVIDAALLIESGFYKKVDSVIVVKSKIKEQIERVKKQMPMSETDINARIGMQMSLRKKLAFADFIIDNGGTKTKTLSQVKKIWETLTR